MKKLKIILSILFTCSILSGNAQDKDKKEETTDNIAFQMALTIQIDSAALSKTIRKIKGVSDVRIDNKKQIVFVTYSDSASINTILQLNKLDASFIKYVEQIPIEKPVVVQKPVATEQPSERQRLNDFLDSKDSAIFDSKFTNLSQKQIEGLHPRDRNYYLLIRNIYNLRGILSNMDKKKSELVNSENWKDITEATKKQVLKDILQSEHNKAETIVTDITENYSAEVGYLSDSQLEYYRNLLNVYFQVDKQVSPKK